MQVFIIHKCICLALESKLLAKQLSGNMVAMATRYCLLIELVRKSAEVMSVMGYRATFRPLVL